MRRQDLQSGLEVIDTSHILKGRTKVYHARNRGRSASAGAGLSPLTQPPVNADWQALEPLPINFKLGNFVGQPISFRLQRRIVSRKIVYLCFQQHLVGGSLSSNS
jgi:hypothetical protein